MVEERGPLVIAKYRGYGTCGGAFFGGILGSAYAGMHLHAWASPFASFAGVVALGAAIGAVVGFLFVEVFFNHLLTGGLHPPSSSSHGDSDSLLDVSDCHPIDVDIWHDT